ncbi:Enhancer of polycomb 2 [Folsomia candida]|uniref:Enhancer of polycomb 2 n=1 Tax=Folsomia candida TaxID=158441 RepID=A0A226DDJ7_FOLCA|nr:Enhancer of polycomb 2 [Folsomia candida]
MSKLSFRARALDASKALPIYHSTEIPDSADCSLINRAVPQMPTGMEKEEEAVRISKCFHKFIIISSWLKRRHFFPGGGCLSSRCWAPVPIPNRADPSMPRVGYSSAAAIYLLTYS